MHPSPVLFAVLTGAALALSSPTARAQGVPPPNDNFANRMVLTGQAVSSTPVAISAATREGLEGDTGNLTVWYTWTAPQDGIVTMTTAGTTYLNKMQVYNGEALANLVYITGDGYQDTASVSFFAKGGFDYQISIGDYYSGSNDTGMAVLNINNKATTITAPVVIGVPAAANDNFANAANLPGATVSGFTYPNEASREGQEPSYTGNSTVWWTWTAPADATVTMSTAGTDFNNRMTVFNGSSLTDLTVVRFTGYNNTNSVTFPTKAGSSYYICVGAYGNGGTDSVMNITTTPLTITSPVVIQSQAAANDNFANAQDLGSNPVVTGFGFNDSATTETLESAANGKNTLWWNWTAPQDGSLTVSTSHTDFDHYLVESTGDSLAALVPGNPGRGTASSPTGGTASVTAGTLYHFVIGSSDGSTGTAVLNLSFVPGLAHVSVVATTPSVFVSQDNTATFTLARDGDLSKLLVVNYTVKGSNGLESQSFSGTKKIKPGKATANVNITIYGSDFFKAKLKFSVTPGEGYTVPDPTPAKEKVFGDD